MKKLDLFNPLEVVRHVNNLRKDKEFWVSSKSEEARIRDKMAKMGQKISELNKKLKECGKT